MKLILTEEEQFLKDTATNFANERSPINHFRDLNSSTIERLFENLDKNIDYQFSRESVSLFDLLKANEIFVLDLISGIYSVKSYKKRKFEVSETLRIYSIIINSILDQ